MSEDFDVHFLTEVKDDVLDRYLAKGWYRMGLYIFTTHSLQPTGDDNSYPVFWLRYEVGKVRLSRSSRALIKLTNSFTATVRTFSLTLIAAGILDRGRRAIAGIINFYDPAYKKYGLGKYLVLLKYFYCVQQNIPWYYPGYYSPTYPKFDYKLFLDKNATEVFRREQQDWLPYTEFCEE